MTAPEKRGPWYLLTGLMIGIILGVIYTRYIQPVEYIDASPVLLRHDFKDQYRILIAAAYSANGDLVRAKARLELLKDPDIFRALSEQAQRSLGENGSSAEARSLGLLAIALGQAPPGPALAVTRAATPPASAPALATPVDLNAPVSSPSAILTTASSQVNPAASDGAYTLLSKEKICDQSLPAPLIQVQVSDQLNRPISGVLFIVKWQSGEERFYTGLKPERGLGYADYTLDPAQVYSIQPGESGESTPDIAAVECTSASGERFWGAWLLSYVQP